MAGKAMGSDKKKDEQKPEGSSGQADWAGVGKKLMKAGADGKLSNKEIAEIGKQGYQEYSKDKKGGTTSNPQELGKKLVGGLFGKK